MKRWSVIRIFLSVIALKLFVGCQYDGSTDLSKQKERTSNTEDKDDAESIRAIIPEAAGMKLSDFVALSRSGSAPKPSDVSDQSLTLILLTLVASPRDSEKDLREFKYLTEGIPDPSKIAKVLSTSSFESENRGKLVLSITDDRITKFSCKAEKDIATGTVDYALPELFGGSVNYIAQKDKGEWMIIEFSMPSRGIRIRFENNLWVNKP